MSSHELGDRDPRFSRFQPFHWTLDEYLGQAPDREAFTNDYDDGVLQADATLERLPGELRRRLDACVVDATAPW